MKKRGTFGIKKIKLDGKVQKMEKKEGMNVFVKGPEGVCVVSFSPQEVNMLKEKFLPPAMSPPKTDGEPKAGWTENKDKLAEVKEEPKKEVPKVEEKSEEKKIEESKTDVKLEKKSDDADTKKSVKKKSSKKKVKKKVKKSVKKKK